MIPDLIMKICTNDPGSIDFMCNSSQGISTKVWSVVNCRSLKLKAIRKSCLRYSDKKDVYVMFEDKEQHIGRVCCESRRINHLTKNKTTQTKKMSLNKMVVLGILIFFSVTLFYSFVISPETGEKILYGKNPPGKMTHHMEYSEIILSGDYQCLESASKLAHGNLPKFVEEFNICHGEQ